LLLAIAVSTAMASDDPFVGKWILDVKREYPADICPVSMVIEMKAAGLGIRYSSDITMRTVACTLRIPA
jgi:hypothetical protein